MKPKPGLLCAALAAGILATFASLPMHAGISVEPGLPAGALISNPTGSSSGTSVVGSGTTPVKGNSFVLASGTSLTSVTFHISGVTDGVGTITLDFYHLSGTPDSIADNGQVPTGASLFTQTETLPGVGGGDYLTITLDTPLALAAGNYAFAISTSNTVFNVTLNKDNAYLEGELVRQVIADGSWQDRANDMVFALTGSAGAITLGNPGAWPATFLENAPGASADSVGLISGTQVGQSFTVVGDADLDTVLVQLDDATASTDLDGSLTLEIFDDDGSGLPTGSALSILTGELPGGITNGSFIEFDLPGTVALSPGNYVATLTTSNTDLLFNSTTGDLLADGALIENTGGGWAAATPVGRDLVIGLTGDYTPPVVRPPAGSGPNILVILADDMSWTDLSSGKPNLGNGSGYHQTPHMDRLADEGISFTSCYVHQNCAPTRAALLSGQYPARSGNGVYNVTGLNRGSSGATPPPAFLAPGQNEDVPAAHYTMAEMLWDAGYVTCHVGKYHVGNHEGGAATQPENQGFDFNYGGTDDGAPGSFFASDVGGGVFQFDRPYPTIDPFADPYTLTYITKILTPYTNGNNPATLDGTMKHLVDAEVDAAVEFLDNHRGGPLSAYPFYLQYHSYAVHGPVQPRPDLNTKYNGIASTDPRHDRADYAGHMEGLDQGIGRILDYLDDPNGDGITSDSIASNTLVIFFSDNGGSEPATENTPLRSRKGAIYEGGIRSPLIVRQPGTVPADVRTDTLVHAVDFFPTLMQAASGSTPRILDGTSFYDHVLDPTGSPRDRGPVFYHFPGYMDNRIRPCEVAIKDIGEKRYKLIYNYDFLYDPNTGDDGIMVLAQPWELYNLTDDLSETANLIDGSYWSGLVYGAIADEMAVDLVAWLTQSDPTWDAKQVTSGGVPVAYPPPDVPDVPHAPGQEFRITDVMVNEGFSEMTLTFNSAAGYLFDIEGTSDLLDPAGWESVVTAIEGEIGSTTPPPFTDPAAATAPHRYYRVIVRPGA